MKHWTPLFWIGGAVAVLVLLSRPAAPRPAAVQAASQARAILNAWGPVVDDLTRIVGGMFAGQTGTSGADRAPAVFSSVTPASNALATFSGFPPSPDPAQYWDAAIQAA
jgi:hypothetical protein